MRRRHLGFLIPALLVSAVLSTVLAQAPAGDGAAATRPQQGRNGGPAGGRGDGNRLGESAAIDAAAADRGATSFRTSCGFCHGADARGAMGPDLVRSLYVLSDPGGQQLAAFLKRGSPQAGMPAFPDLPDAGLRDLSMFLRRRAAESSAQPGLIPASIVVGDARRGEAYFNGAGRCNTCHSPTGDFRGIGARYNPLVLQGRMINPRAVAPGRGVVVKPLPSPKVRVLMRDGTVVAGDLVTVDDFFVTLVEANGNRRTIARDNETPQVDIDDPIEAHRQQMLKYTDDIMHDLTAYLVSLK